MSGYTNTDALSEAIWSLYRDEEYIDYNVAIVDVLNVIDELPTADVVEVVPCKDCKWNKSTPHNPICSNDDMPKDVGFFCADGERREDGCNY